MSTVDQVQAHVLRGLLRGDYAPGTWLRQDDLATEVGVSRVPVREGLQRLSGLGLVRFETNRGAMVPTLTAADAIETYALRRGIEPQLLEQAIPHQTIVDLAEAELAVDGGTDRTTTEANWAFHRALYRAAGWARGLAMVEILHAAVAPYVLLYTRGLGGADDSHAEHVAMLDACRDSDIDAALARLAEHLDHAEAALVTWLRDRDTLA